jgi:hypothetical protein
MLVIFHLRTGLLDGLFIEQEVWQINNTNRLWRQSNSLFPNLKFTLTPTWDQNSLALERLIRRGGEIFSNVMNG